MAIFMAVVIGLIVEPVPAALIGFAGVSLVAVLGLMGSAGDSIKWALSRVVINCPCPELYMKSGQIIYTFCNIRFFSVTFFF